MTPLQLENILGKAEDDMLARIKAFQPFLGYKVETVDTYGSEFSDGVERAMRDWPAYLFVYNGSTPMAGSTQRLLKYKARWAVLCCSGSLRGEAAARKGSITGAGSYQMLCDARRMLRNFVPLKAGTFEGSAGAIEIAGDRQLLQDKAGQQLVSVYALDIEIPMTEETTGLPATLDDFKTFHADYDIPPHGNVQRPPPSEETADATDNVTLETDNE